MIRSMTGYGRCEQAYEDKTIQVEIRSVNHRFFEFSSRIPRVYAFLEDKIKAYVQGRVSRGKVDVFVTINTISTPSAMYQIGEDVPISLPAEVAMIPSVTNVIAVPAENTAE